MIPRSHDKLPKVTDLKDVECQGLNLLTFSFGFCVACVKTEEMSVNGSNCNQVGHPALKMMILRDNILDFKNLEDKMLLDCFYRGLGPVNREEWLTNFLSVVGELRVRSASASPTWTMLDSLIFQVGAYKTWRAHGLIGDWPNKSTSLTLSVVWTPKSTGGPVKLGEVGYHSVNRRVVRRGQLIPANGPQTERFLKTQDMARPKVTGRDVPPHKRAKGITIDEDATASKVKATKLTSPLLRVRESTWTLRLTFLSLRMINCYWLGELRYAPRRCMIVLGLGLKADGLRTFIEEKRLSTDGVVDRYPEIWCTLKSHKFQIFTKPLGLYIPNWVQEFYTAYGALVPQGKRKATTFNPVYYVVIWAKKVKCDSDAINEVLECTENIANDY
uniref:Putative plant transposon protein domain-containing protein n=1 Tax=Solanum tuberosum TaxID=4113 RepID=M1DAG9_SOLTU